MGAVPAVMRRIRRRVVPTNPAPVGTIAARGATTTLQGANPRDPAGKTRVPAAMSLLHEEESVTSAAVDAGVIKVAAECSRARAAVADAVARGASASGR